MATFSDQQQASAFDTLGQLTCCSQRTLRLCTAVASVTGLVGCKQAESRTSHPLLTATQRDRH